jgi:hypothetical protein
MMITSACRFTTRVGAVTGVLVAVLVGGASAATFPKPTATTGPARDVTATSAVVTGSIKPNGQQTDFFVQYGPTTHYGLQTVPIHSLAYAGTPAVSVQLSNLAAFTKYHYRLVVSNPSGVGTGLDKTFTTPKIPLSVGIAATPMEVPFLSGTTISGALAGTGGGGREVQLQSSPTPSTQPFAAVGNPEVTNADGSYAFNVLPASVLGNTNFRVVTVGGGAPLVSPTVTVGVLVDVTAHISTRRARHGRLLHFKGTIAPAEVGSLVEIQKLVNGKWVNIAITTSSSKSSAITSTFDKTVHVNRGGFFRVYDHVAPGENHMSNGSNPVSIPFRR